MAFRATDLKLVIREIAPAVTDGWIQKIYQPLDRTLVIECRGHGTTHRLLISCEPETARIHLTRHRLSNPPTPPPFCQFLRAHLTGARFDRLRQLNEDRIVAMDLTTKQGPRTLLCELTGPKANILLLDEHGYILRDLSRLEQVTGRLYRPPALGRSASAQHEAARFDTTALDERFPVSAAIEMYYAEQEARLASSRARHEQMRALRKTLAKTQRRIDAWRGDLAKATTFRDYARYGELLKANLGSVTPGMDQVTLVDYYDSSLPEVSIPLDQTKSALSNMADYFKKHRKYMAAERILVPRIEQAERDLDALRRQMHSIEQGTWTFPVPSRPMPPSRSRAKVSAQTPRGPFRRFTSADGLPIFVGRSARENDELTFKFANNEDLWLHARGASGSHVIVRLSKGAEPPPETLRDAATLALLYSGLKKSAKGEVVYTKRKWVKPAKRQAPGAVVITQEKTIHVHLDTKRLEALKARNETLPA
jgi:predicted ribosome quality control (RQC) complex YloA/Tae2 family protein